MALDAEHRVGADAVGAVRALRGRRGGGECESHVCRRRGAFTLVNTRERNGKETQRVWGGGGGGAHRVLVARLERHPVRDHHLILSVACCSRHFEFLAAERERVSWNKPRRRGGNPLPASSSLNPKLLNFVVPLFQVVERRANLRRSTSIRDARFAFPPFFRSLSARSLPAPHPSHTRQEPRLGFDAAQSA